jgi:hypothetical protein
MCRPLRLRSDAVRFLAVTILSVLVLVGCTRSADANAPAPTTTAPFTHAQVMSWVTPTLANGITFAGSLSLNSTADQMLAASRPLSTAAAVSLRELAEVSWTGALQPREMELATALMRIKNLTAASPGPAYLGHLDKDIVAVQGALRALNHSIAG